MGITLRGTTRWISYTLPKDVAAEFGVKRLVRESAHTGDKRAAEKLLAQRKREIRDGSWRPSGLSGASLLVSTYRATWTAARTKRGVLSAARDEGHLAPLMKRLGPMRLADVRRTHVLAAMADMQALSAGRTGKGYAPGSVRLSYDTLRAMFGAAERAGLIQSNPCNLRSADGELPKDEDADPQWRAKAIFTRGELEQLVSDERIPLKRRVLYGLQGLAGMRKGEAVARSWDDYDAVIEPLGSLHVHSQYDGRRLKTGNPRHAPVHPVLAKLVAEWKLLYERECCRRPEGEALIVPSALGAHYRPATVWELLQTDLARLGMRRRRVHDLRRTFISLARADGASDLLRWVTHGPRKTVFDQYTTPPWEALCKDVACLRVELRGASKVLPMKRKA